MIKSVFLKEHAFFILTINLIVAMPGIEPGSRVSETLILSVEIHGQFFL